ncbi:MAG TPA: recombinase family protein [Symbiobacteriaceae bacterium]|nr:recombinase family protein [Symbiobacteriaceae bacterium]
MPLKAIHPDRVAIYIRWSTDDQADGTTLEVQQEGCRHYVLSQGWNVSPELIFVDDGYSGGNLERPALRRLRALVAGGGIDCVVVFKLDRLSRSVVDMVNLVLEEWEGRTHVKSAREPVDTSSAMGKQFFYMLVSFAEWERSVIRERTAAGRLARAREGYKPSSRAPYGYRHGETTGSYAVDEQEADVVRRIFDWYARGMGAKAIVVRLNAEAIPFRAGHTWNERTLLYLLSNPVYTGRSVYGRRSRNPRRGKGPGETYWLRSEQVTAVAKSPFVPAIIAEELFTLAQQVKAGRRLRQAEAPVSPRATASPYLVTGLARCPCGASLYVRTQRVRGKEYQTYACLAKKVRGAACCAAANIPRQLLEARVEQELLERYGDRLARQRYTDALAQSLSTELHEAERLATGAAQRVQRLEAEERRLRLDYREGRLTAAEFRTVRQDVLDDLAEARGAQQQAAARGQALEQKRSALGAQLEAMARIDHWADLSPAERKNLVRCFVAALVARADPTTREIHLQVTWHADQQQL